MTATALARPSAGMEEAEAAVLGACLLSGQVCAQAVAALRSEDFVGRGHAALFELIAGMAAAGRLVDAATASSEARRLGVWERVGGPAYVAGLTDPDTTPSVGAAGEYIRIVRDASVRRKVVAAGERLRQLASGPRSTEDLLSSAVAELRAVDAIPDPATPSPVPLAGIDLSALETVPHRPDFLVEDRLTRRSLVLLGAKPGVGKSWVAASLAVALAMGEPWLGHQVAGPSRVLYLDAENGADVALRRLRQLGATLEGLAGRLIYSTELVVLSQSDDLARLDATLAQFQPDLVILDTLASHSPEAETDAPSMALFLANVWSKVHAAGGSMLLVHHFRKSLQGAGRDDPLDAFRGSGHLTGAASRAWVLEPVTPGQPVFVLRDVKPREFAAVDPVKVRVLDVGEGDARTTRVVCEGAVATVEAGFDAFLEAVLTALDAVPTARARTGPLVNLREDLGIAERTAKDYLKRAISTGVLRQPARGWYCRTSPDLLPFASVEEGDA